MNGLENHFLCKNILIYCKNLRLPKIYTVYIYIYIYIYIYTVAIYKIKDNKLELIVYYQPIKYGIELELGTEIN